MSNGAIKLAPLMAEIKVDIASFKSDMSKIKAEAISRANEVSKQMERTIKVGNQMSNVGGKLTKSLTHPLAGAGAGSYTHLPEDHLKIQKVSQPPSQWNNCLLYTSNKEKKVYP